MTQIYKLEQITSNFYLSYIKNIYCWRSINILYLLDQTPNRVLATEDAWLQILSMVKHGLSHWTKMSYFNVFFHSLRPHQKTACGIGCSSVIKFWICRKSIKHRSRWTTLTHWGRVTHICISKLTIIDSDNGLSPEWCQAIIWTNAGIL